MSLFGHPLHPMLVPLPIGAFVFGVTALILFAASGDSFWLQGSYWLAIAGVATALAAAVAGFMDWLGIPGDSRNKNIGGWHLTLNLTLVGLFFVSWLILGGFGGATGSNATLALVLQMIGALMLVASGWLGGEMVFGKAPEEEQKPQERPRQETADRPGGLAVASKTAAEILIDTIHDGGVDVVFGLPGDGMKGIMEALRKRQDRVRT